MTQKPYQVLARRTRPHRFSELIGQEALCETLCKAIQSNRLAHAYIFTGTRGVGKTTTARLIALALNCIGPDGKGGITTEPCGVCDQCKAIQEDRHVDVSEVDAATRTGVDDVRQLMEGMSYTPVMGRFKVYIIDEVHMLSKSAFNALLKTLEEPPAHVKFIFATTEIKKVPLTILSRCQRYDLRRVDINTLVQHFESILRAEDVSFEPAAVHRIAELAHGSVRDGLSILEQMIAQASGTLTLDRVMTSLGLFDHKDIEDLCLKLLQGDVKGTLDLFSNLMQKNMDVQAFMEHMLSVLHKLIMAKSLKTPLPKDSILRDRIDKLPLEQLLIVWTIFTKGADELRTANLLEETLEVILIRAMHVQGFGHASTQTHSTSASPSSTAQPKVQTPYQVASFPEVVALFQKKKEPLIGDYLTHNVGLISFSEGRIELSELKPMPSVQREKIAQLLKGYTGKSWDIVFLQQAGADSLAAQKEKEAQEHTDRLLRGKEAEAIQELFPGAKVNVN